MWYIIGAILLYIVWRKLTKIEVSPTTNPEDSVFKSSFLHGSNPLIREKLIVDEEYVTWVKNKGIDTLWLGTSILKVQKRRITGVGIINKVIGTDVVIMTEGNNNIRVHNLKHKDAMEIQQLLTP